MSNYQFFELVNLEADANPVNPFPGSVNETGQIVGLLLGGLLVGSYLYDYRHNYYTQIIYPGSSPFNNVVTDINDAGQAVGSYDGGGFLYFQGNYFQLPLGPLAMNDVGEIIDGHTSLYFQGNLTTISDPLASGGKSFLRDINNAGQIVGNYIDSNGVTHGFLYSNGTYTTIDDGTGTNLTHINNSGQILGGSENGAFLYSGGTFTPIDDPVASVSNARTLNDAGEVVGFYETAGNVRHGFVYSNGSYTTVDQPMFGNADAVLIDDRGQIIGTYLDSSGSKQHVFLATPENAPYPAPSLVLSGYGSAAGWSSQDVYLRLLADVNGDGMADIVGFASDGVHVSLATGVGTFATPTLGVVGFGITANAGGWTSQDQYPRALGDVNGDGMADIIGFGAAGTYVSLDTGAGNFAAAVLALNAFAAAGGWNSQNLYPRAVADVNGDGMADIVGFASDGVHVSLATHAGDFGAPTLALLAFGSAASAGGWNTQDLYPRLLADVNGDGMADIVGFASDGVHVSLATGGGTFAEPILAFDGFGTAASAGGWTSQDEYLRELADVNGDGRADIIAFGITNTYLALGNPDGTFNSPLTDVANFGTAPQVGGWTSQDLYPRAVGDVNGDRSADIVGFGAGGVYQSLAQHSESATAATGATKPFP